MLNVLLTIGFLQVLTMAVNLVRTKALALLLGPGWIGVMAVVDKLLAVLAQTASLSMPFAAVRFLPGLWSRDPGGFTRLIWRMRNLLILTVLAATVLGLVVTLEFPGAWGTDLLPYRSIVFIAFLSLPVVAFVPFLQNAIASRLQHNYSMLFVLAHAVVFTLAGVLGAWWNGLVGLYGLYAVLGLLVVIPVMRTVRRIPDGTSLPVSAGDGFSIGLPREIWKFSLALFGLTFVTPFAAVYVHYQVLRYFGLKPAGWMQAAMGIGFSLRTLLGSASAVFLTPNVNRGGSPEERMCLVVEYYNTLGILCALVGLPLLLFPHQVLRILYSLEFLAAVPFVAWFVVGEVLGLLAGTLQSLVVAFDHIAFHVIQNVTAQALLLTVAFLLIEDYGILGAGVATMSAPLLLYVSTALFLRRKCALTLPLRSWCLGVFLIGSLALGGIIGVKFPEMSLGVLAGKCSLYGTFLVGLWVILGPLDRAKLWTFGRNVRRYLSPSHEGLRF